jgi:hypothetical protein
MIDLFLFGAGASAAEGAPATANLFPEAWRLFAGRQDRRVERVWRFLAEVWGQPVGAPADFARLPHLDDVVSMIDWSLHMEQGLGPSWGPRELWDLRQDLTYLLSATLGAAMARGLPQPGGPHERFVRGLGGRPAVLLSLNYDTLLERALKAGGVEPDYGFDRLNLTAVSPSIPLLKLHGSLNWAHCPACDRIAVLAHPLGKRADPVCTRCGSAALDRLIITPTWLKRYTATQLRHVWDLALEAVQAAERLTFIGYSLPPNDVAVAQFLRRAILARPQGRTLEVRVINRTRSGPPEAQYQGQVALADRFIRHFGPGVTFDWRGFHGQVDEADAFRPFHLPL